MSRLVRTDLLKQRTVRLFVAGFAAGPVIGGLVVLAVYAVSGRQGNDPLGPDSLFHAVTASRSVITTLALLLGVFGMAGEFRHQTITTTYLTTPRRRDVVLSKMAAHALTGAAMAVATVAGALAVAIPWLVGADVPLEISGDVVRGAAWVVLSTGLHAAAGVGIGAALRNQTAAVIAVLVWLLAVEGLLADVLRLSGGGPHLLHWLPLAAVALIGIPRQTRKDIS